MISPSETRTGRHRPTPFDWLTKFAVPFLSLVMASLEKDRTLASGFLAFGLIVLFSGLYRPGLEGLSRRRSRKRDERAAPVLLLEFTRLVDRFAEFVSPQVNRTLHEILKTVVFRTSPSDAVRLGLPPIRVLETPLRHLRTRLTESAAHPRALAGLVLEFADLVADYDAHCVRPVFGSFPADLQHFLTPEAKRALESFRERYVSFREGYEDFEKKLAATLVTVKLRPLYFDHPKPL